MGIFNLALKKTVVVNNPPTKHNQKDNKKEQQNKKTAAFPHVCPSFCLHRYPSDLRTKEGREQKIQLNRTLLSLARVVLGDGLGALRDGVLGQLTGEDQADSSLDFARRDGVALVVAGQLAGFGGQALEDVVDEVVHDDHRLAGDAGVRVHLLQHLVDVRGVGVGVRLTTTLGSVLSLGGGLACLLGCLS